MDWSHPEETYQLHKPTEPSVEPPREEEERTAQKYMEEGYYGGDGKERFRLETAGESRVRPV